MAIVPLAQSDRCPIPDAGVQHGSAQILVDRDLMSLRLKRFILDLI
jgi:hypothetical protein